MDGRQFAKLCKDTKLIGSGFTATDVDLIFAKVKDQKARKINFKQFQAALDQIGAKKGTSGEQVIETLVAAGGPKYSGTKAEATRLHDDKSQYTGVYAQGGPSTVDKGHDLADLADRSEATVRGTKKQKTQGSKKNDQETPNVKQEKPSVKPEPLAEVPSPKGVKGDVMADIFSPKNVEEEVRGDVMADIFSPKNDEAQKPFPEEEKLDKSPKQVHKKE